MKTSQPPILATRMLQRLASGPHGDALAGDLIEQYREGRSTAWYWRQVLLAIVVCLAKDRTLGGLAILGSLLVILLMSVGVVRHPSSLGSGLFITNITLLSCYGAFAVWVWRQQRPERRAALRAGAQAGVILYWARSSSRAMRLSGSRWTETERRGLREEPARCC